ncbi:PREDICTED: GSK3-beta interaction protein [Ceratosolen solmsi marchali]|uniref:GSK3-beta interaction protein n=1 Tax=Ceratosolen solmsi marchali TaxID=326594 RepID=A0AAJ6YKR6_9HYME|nr:PREDICTED: GSK3-beta interaction protein [Ceratosolen solmsi marchali]
MVDKEKRIFDAEQWRLEAQAVINDIRYHVHHIKICDDTVLTSNKRSIYLNLTTLEHFKFCIRLSPQGFSIVSNEHNYASKTNQDDDSNFEYFETIYSLLDSVSPEYRNSFGKSLLDRLNLLSESQKQ